LGYAENAVRRLEPSDPPQAKAEINLLLGNSAFLQYRKVRDKNLLVKSAVPAFKAVTEDLLLNGAAHQKGEAFAFLAWCEMYLGHRDGAEEEAKKVSAELGAHSELAVWAHKASLQAKVVENAKDGAIVTVGMVLIIAFSFGFVIVLLLVIGWLLKLPW
jgi:hypothetical protein